MIYAPNGQPERKLFLDDTREKPDATFFAAKDAEWFVVALEAYRDSGFIEIWFDHDLGEGQNGAWCLEQLIYRIETQDYPRPERIIIHTANPDCKRSMIQRAERYFQGDVQIIDFNGLTLKQRTAT